MTTPDSRPVRVRMAPSPTGSPHVGLARTALYNWAFARHHGGTFVFRIEDTDKARNTEESYDSLIDLMQWLGLSWDEGVVVGGAHGPYRQSERTEIYADVLTRLRESSYTYDCFCTNDEVEARRADLEKVQADKLAAARALGDKMDGTTVQITEKAGVDGRLFGSVTNFDIAEVLTKQGHAIEKAMVRMPSGPIKAVGEHTVQVAPHADVVVEVNVVVTGETA